MRRELPLAGVGQTDGVKAESSVDRAGRAGMVEGVIRRGFLRRLTGVVPGTRIGRVRWPRALLMRPWRWHDGAGRPERAATTGKGPGDLAAVPMPEPGEPPAHTTHLRAPDEIEFVPQEPTRWLEPKLLVLIAVQVALSTKFAEFFDRRDAQRASSGDDDTPTRTTAAAGSRTGWSAEPPRRAGGA